MSSADVVSLQEDERDDEGARPLAESLLMAIADLLFCPDFTVQSHKKAGLVRIISFHIYTHKHII